MYCSDRRKKAQSPESTHLNPSAGRTAKKSGDCYGAEGRPSPLCGGSTLTILPPDRRAVRFSLPFDAVSKCAAAH